MGDSIRRVIVAMLLASAFSAGAAGAETRGLTIRLKASEAANAPVSGEVRLYESSFALVIGIDAYTGGWPRLSNAVKDARLVAQELEKRGFDVTLKTNLKSQEMKSAFEEFFVVKGADPQARLFVWFAGHGHTADDEGFLVPADAPKPSTGPRFKLKALNMRRFGEFVRQAESKHAFAVFDSCFAGTVFDSQRALPPEAITHATTKPVRQFLTSGDATQTVSDDGTFRELFLRALRGEERADANGDGYVTGSEMGLFLSDRVTNLTRTRQTPRYGKLRDKDFDLGDFVFALAAPISQTTVTPPPATSPSGMTAEMMFWQSIKDSKNTIDFKAYLEQFPGGTFAPLARNRMAALGGAQEKAKRRKVSASRQRDQEMTLGRLRDQKNQKGFEIQELEARRVAAGTNLSLAREELKISKTLLAKQLVPKSAHLRQEAEVRRLEAELRVIEVSIQRVRASMADIDVRIEEVLAKPGRDLVAALSPVGPTGLSPDMIREAQRILTELGYAPGPADGIMGSRTHLAIERFQRMGGLGVDGLVSEALLASLKMAHKQVVALSPALAPPPAPSPAKPAVGVYPEPHKPGQAFKDCSECPEMVVVPAGFFTMGSPPGEEGRSKDEGPRHRVTIPRPFAVGRFEVTRGEFASFVRDSGHSTGKSCWTYESELWKNRGGRGWRDPGYRQTERDPVVCVSWDDAKAYVEWLSRKTGKTYRLLSEAEWEYSARAGTTTARVWGDSPKDACGEANVHDQTSKRFNGFYQTHHNCDDGHAKTAPVGNYRANRFGLHDVLGNVWEWVEDCWHDSYGSAPTGGGVWTNGDGCRHRVLRGGSWINVPKTVRAASRNGIIASNRNNNNGFRIARVISR